MDLSGSIFDAGKRNELRDAAKGFVDSLGAQSSVALFSFGNASPRAGTVNQATPLNVGTQRAQIDTIIDNYWANTVSGQGTNWDAGMWEASQGAVAHGYDIVLVLTDGNPTYSGTSPNGNGSTTTFRELERAVYSSNVIKQAGSRVVTVGIGGNLSAHNLAAVSGPQGYAAGRTLNETDYVITGWDALKSLLEDFAKGLECQAQVTVTKLAGNEGETPAPAAGWEFEATGGAPGALSPTGAQQTNGSGQIAWRLTFDQPDDTGTVQVTETQQSEAGWELTGLVCTMNGEDLELPLGLTATIPGIGVGDTVQCTYTNTKRQATATVQVNKTWVLKDQTGATIETYHLRGEGADPAPPAWLIAAPSLTPAPNPAPGPGGVQWGTPYSGYVKDGKVGVGETASLGSAAPPGCTITAKQLTSGPGITDPVNLAGGPHEAALGAGANVFGITNTVTCTTKLTLLKEVDKTNVPTSTLQPSDWELTAANGANKVLDGVTGSTTPSAANTANVTAGTAYALSEVSANGQLAYTQLGIQQCRTVTGTGASASCAEWETGYLTGDEVTVALGQHGIYRFVNQPIPPVTVPLTGGMSADLFGIWGVGLAVLAAITAIVYTGRLRRQMEVR
jgi:hypothetical protein